MKKINLKSDELTVKRDKNRSGNTSLSVGIIILLITLGSYGVLMLIDQKTIGEIELVKSEIATIKKDMDSSELRELYDFQSRLYEIEGLLKNKTSQNENLERIAAFTLSGTSFVELQQQLNGQQTEVSAVVIVPDHYVLSQQLEAYSLMDGAKDVSLINSKQGDEGVEAEIRFAINK